MREGTDCRGGRGGGYGDSGTPSDGELYRVDGGRARSGGTGARCVVRLVGVDELAVAGGVAAVLYGEGGAVVEAAQAELATFLCPARLAAGGVWLACGVRGFFTCTVRLVAVM